MTRLVPVFLAGGSGTRLWPLSRDQYPKQFLKLFGDNTLLQDTALRTRSLADVQTPLAICGEKHRFIVAEQLLEAGIDGATVVLEPEGRNTAPAAAVAAQLVLEKYGPDALVLLLPADQVIADVERFRIAVRLAAATAERGHIVTFGVRPTRPETGFGYMKSGAMLAGGAFAIDNFVEKPDALTAQAYVDAGNYYWNGGIFLFQAGAFLDELRSLEPDTFEGAVNAVTLSRRDLDFIRLDYDAFLRTRADSIDYAIMEKTLKAAMVPLDAGWDDVGSWRFLEALNKDSSGNVCQGDVLLESSRENLIHAQSRLVALVGVDNHIVVETKDAILVTTRDHVQDVKKIVAKLTIGKRSEAKEHSQVFRPWGCYESIADGERFQVKRIIVKPGHKLSLQMHHHRAEHWVVVKGTAQVTCGDKIFLLREDQSTYIPLGEKHRLENPGSIHLELIEVQSGAYLGEDDIVRFEDSYGRQTAL